jgi:hypothetical protein
MGITYPYYKNIISIFSQICLNLKNENTTTNPEGNVGTAP